MHRVAAMTSIGCVTAPSNRVAAYSIRPRALVIVAIILQSATGLITGKNGPVNVSRSGFNERRLKARAHDVLVAREASFWPVTLSSSGANTRPKISQNVTPESLVNGSWTTKQTFVSTNRSQIWEVLSTPSIGRPNVNTLRRLQIQSAQMMLVVVTPCIFVLLSGLLGLFLEGYFPRHSHHAVQSRIAQPPAERETRFDNARKAPYALPTASPAA
eukprot:TRINITY_DN14448_c0_g1_i1.p1 TRINITY_DN14448_c0_g1~~TRINITY_DN14448_c0_g1_i1.p1  ORF type:complete len:215 (-),score=19.94 TRINITY_DN14448_c0_g1_i1:123-767(-)